MAIYGQGHDISTSASDHRRSETQLGQPQRLACSRNPPSPPYTVTLYPKVLTKTPRFDLSVRGHLTPYPIPQGFQKPQGLVRP